MSAAASLAKTDWVMKDGQWKKQTIKDSIGKFNEKAAITIAENKKNPFADTYKQPVHKITDKDYGRPEAGSLTEKRGIKAGNYHI